MASAASATLRLVSAGRSSITAMSTMLIMIHERTVGTAAPQRRGRSPFLDGKAERKRRNKCEQRAHEPEHGSGHDHHMQAGNGKDVREARKARSLVQLLGNASPRAGDERDGDLAGLTSNTALMRALTRALSASMPDQALRSQGKAPASFKD
jgi:hypothetical protein